MCSTSATRRARPAENEGNAGSDPVDRDEIFFSGGRAPLAPFFAFLDERDRSQWRYDAMETFGTEMTPEEIEELEINREQLSEELARVESPAFFLNGGALG